MTLLTEANVTRIYDECCFVAGEDMTMRSTAVGLAGFVALSPERLRTHLNEIEALLDGILEGFTHVHGGTIDRAHLDLDGEPWTDDPAVVEKLLLLGICVGRVVWLAPVDDWPSLSGGVAWFRITPPPGDVSAHPYRFESGGVDRFTTQVVAAA